MAKGFSRALLVAGVGLSLASCDGGPDIIARDQRKSPDGYWTVKTQIERWSGPGNNYMQATAYLSRSSEPDKSEQILAVVIPSQEMGDISVSWRGKQHLDLSYRKGMTVDLLVARYGGLDISAASGAL